jgi:hypothetical protein
MSMLRKHRLHDRAVSRVQARALVLVLVLPEILPAWPSESAEICWQQLELFSRISGTELALQDARHPQIASSPSPPPRQWPSGASPRWKSPEEGQG